MLLTKQQLEQLTGKKYAQAQAHELDYLDIAYKKRRNGSLAVLCKAVEKSLGVDYSENPNQPKTPNWAALDNAKTTQ